MWLFIKPSHLMYWKWWYGIGWDSIEGYLNFNFDTWNLTQILKYYLTDIILMFSHPLLDCAKAHICFCLQPHYYIFCHGWWYRVPQDLVTHESIKDLVAGFGKQLFQPIKYYFCWTNSQSFDPTPRIGLGSWGQPPTPSAHILSRGVGS